MKPTSRQIDFIKDICETLRLKEPTCKTVWDASIWIQNHLDSYNDATRENKMDYWDEEDYELHGCCRDDYH